MEPSMQERQNAYEKWMHARAMVVKASRELVAVLKAEELARAEFESAVVAAQQMELPLERV